MNLIYKYAKDFHSSINYNGLWGTFKILLCSFTEWFFDFRYGVDTASSDTLQEIEPSVRASMTFYAPSRILPIKKCFEEIKFKQGNFVDFGCGKGRVLMLALKAGFIHVKGIELSEKLLKISRNNLSKFFLATSYSLIHDNFLNYVPNDKDSVFYFYDPCDIQLVKEVIEKIDITLSQSDRPVCVIYHHNLIDKNRLKDYQFKNLKFHKKIVHYGNSFYVFTNYQLD